MKEIIYLIFHIFFLITLNTYPYFIRKKLSENFYISSVKGFVILSFIILLFSFLNLDLKYLLLFIFFIFIINLIYLFIDWKKNVLLLNRILFFSVILFIFSINVLFNLKLGWDAQNYWYPRALNFIQGAGIDNLKNLTRPDYPYFGSYLWAIFSEISFLKFEYFGRIFYIYLFCLSVFSLSEKIDSKILFQSLISIIILLILFNYNLFNGYQEIVVFSYAIILSIISFDWIQNKKNIDLILIFVSGFIIFWIKNEAFIFSLLFMFILIFCFDFKNRTKLIFISCVFFLILARYFLFKFFGLEFDLQKGNYESLNLSLALSKFTITRIFEIIFYLIVGFAKNPLIFVILFSIIFLLIKNKENKFIMFYSLNFILGIIVIFGAYILTSFPLEFHLKTSVDRLIFEIIGFNLLMIVFSINYMINRN